MNVAGKLVDVITRRGFLASASVAALAGSGCGRKRATGFDGYAFVANAEGRAIAAVDLTAFAVVRHVRLDADPTEVIAHPGMQAVFALTPATGVVHEIDGGRLTAVRKLQAGSSAISMRMAWEDPRRLFVLYRDPRRLACFSLATGAVEWQASLPSDASDFDVAPDGRTCVVSFGAAGAIGVVEGATRHIQRLETDSDVRLVRFRSDGRAMLAGDVTQNRLLIFDTERKRLVVRLPLAVRPDQFCSSGDGGQIFVTGEGLDAVVVVYPYATQVAETVLAGRKPGAMAASSGRPPYLFIANPTSGDVTIMNVTTRKVQAIASVGADPGFIAITPDNQFALVLNRRSGDMGVLRIHDKLQPQRKSAGLFTMIPVGSKPVSAAVRQA